VTEVGAQIAAFAVDVRDADAFGHFDRRVSRIEPDTAVPSLVGAMKKSLEGPRREYFRRHIASLCLDFLHANHIGALPGNPGEQSLARGGTNAVEIECDYA